MSRMSVDLDGINNFKKIEGKLKLLETLFPDKPIFYRRSSSGKGYHLKVENLNMDKLEIIRWRRKLGDDMVRQMFDFARLRKKVQVGVLFSEKAGKEAGNWKRWSK